MAQRRGEQFVAGLSGGQGVTWALSRLSAGLFVNDISVATLRAERTALADAIARQDSTAALRHFGTIAKAMAFNPSATNAGAAAVGREIGRFKNVTAPRLLATVRPRASGTAPGASRSDQKALGAGPRTARAHRGPVPTAPFHRLPVLGGSSAAAPPQPARLERASRVTHTRGTGTQAEVETRFWEQREQALKDALRSVNERIKTLLPGGPSVAQLAREVYRERPELQAVGLSEDEFVSQVKAPGKLAWGDGGGRVRASAGGGAGVGAEQDPILERYYMPSIYTPNPDWAIVMHDSVGVALDELNKMERGMGGRPHSGALWVVLDQLIMAAKTRLQNGASVERLNHALFFGDRRQNEHQFTFGEDSRYNAFRPLAISRLQELGQEKTARYLHPTDPQGGGTLHKKSSRLEFSYPDTEGVIPLGRLTGSLWLPGHDDPRMNQPWGRVIYKSAIPEVISPMLRAADRVFQGAIGIARKLDGGSLSKDEPTLTSIVDHAAEVYWLVSHAWPYQRGSACIADLSTKVIFDRLGIEVPAFKPEHYPNINALFSPVEMFRVDYPSFFQGDFRWAR